MNVICKGNTRNALSAKYMAATPAETYETAYYVSIRKEYEVFGIALWNSTVHLLLLDDSNLPDWYPVDLFTVVDAKLPDNWFFSTTVANEHGVEALWGYEQLARTASHYEAILERDPDALRIFFEERWRRTETP